MRLAVKVIGCSWLGLDRIPKIIKKYAVIKIVGLGKNKTWIKITHVKAHIVDESTFCRVSL
jgi:hypothetical protein